MTDSVPSPRVAGMSELLRNGLSVIGPDKPRLVLAAILSLIVGILETALLYIVASIAIAMSGSRTLIKLGPAGFHADLSIDAAVGIGLGVVVALLLLSFPLSTILASLSARAMVRLRGRMIRAYLAASLHFRETHREGLLQQLIGEYSLRAENSVQQLALACVTLCMLVTVLAGAIVSSPLVALGLIVGLALCGILLAPVIALMRQDATKPILTNREIVGRVAQANRISEEIAAYHVAGPVAGGLQKDIVSAAASMGKLRFEGRLVPNLFQYGAIGLVLVLIAVLASLQPDRLVGLAPLALLLVRALAYIRQLQRAVHIAREMAPYIGAIDTELAALEANADPAGTVALARFDTIDFDAVAYAYKTGDDVLHDVTFAVRPGEMIGVVGPSGSGKSTLGGLLLRLRFPVRGSITVGGVPLGNITADSWARLSAFVPQESRLIHGTVGDNIRFFRDGYGADEVIAAARGAHLHDEIMHLPDGFDTLIGPGARGLSGGQRQRLSIARALLARPQLIVMDEPTSALDQTSELLIGQTIAELKGRVTIILIAHRPATLKICDRILQVEKGVLTERTVTHDAA